MRRDRDQTASGPGLRQRPEASALLRSLPKVELHRHLEGAMRLSTLLELGRNRGLQLPLDDEDALAPHVTWQTGQPRELPYFLSKFRADWYAGAADVERVAAEAVADAAAEGIVYLELRFSPEHFSRHSGLDRDGAMRAVVAGAQAAAGAAGIEVRFLITFTRERFDEPAWRQTIDLAAAMAERGVVGVDLAGDEFAHPNERFAAIMGRARDTGVLGVTIHSGEGTSAASVASAVERLGCDRIGHGISAAAEPRVMALLVERSVTLEVCPTSNYQTGCIDDLADHPLPRLVEAGVAVSLNTDDPSIHGVDLVDEYALAGSLGFGPQRLLALEHNAARAAFIPAAERERLAARIEAGYRAALEPEPP
jgi:adenosine deaminase